VDHLATRWRRSAPARSALTWRQLLRAQAASLLAVEFFILGCRQLRLVLAEFADHYNVHRPHRALGAGTTTRAWRISCRRAGWEGGAGDRLGGLIDEYGQVA